MIEVRGVRKSYAGIAAVKDVSFTIKAGTVFGFLGPNGAGKTTTMKMMVGISRPDAGSILIAGTDSADREARNHIGYMPEAPYFYDRLTGLEFMEFCASLFSRPGTKSEYGRILESMGLADAQHRAIATYSKGMKQRLGFAQALVNHPQYLFLDEPLDGLDPLGRREMKRTILRLKTEGTTIFFNSHILSDTEEICDDIGVLHEGSLLYVGPVRQFCDGMPLEERFVKTIEQRAIRT